MVVPATFRPLTSSDIDPVLLLMSQLYAHDDTIRWDEGRWRVGIQGLLADPASGGIWLIRVNGANAGYLVLTVGYSLEFYGRFGLLDELYIAEPWRGQGLGSSALAFAEEQCRSRGLKALRLEVFRDIVRAQELYRRSGFGLQDERYLMTKIVLNSS